MEKPVTIERLRKLSAGKPKWGGLRDFIACYHEGDELLKVTECYRSVVRLQYVGRRPNSITYALVVSIIVT